MWCNICWRVLRGVVYVVQSIDLTIELSSPVLVQTSHPPTRNLVGKTHDADGGGTTDNGTDDGARDASDDVNESATEMRA